MNNKTSELELLIRYLDDSLTPEKKCEVEQWLLNDAQARTMLRELSEHAVIAADRERVNISLKPANESGKYSAAKNSPAKNSHWNTSQIVVSILAIAALVLVSITTIQFLWRPAQDQNVITILALNGPVEWTGEGGQIRDLLQVGHQLPGGTIVLDAPDAWIEMELNDGSIFTLSGQAVVTLSDKGQKRIHLRNGSLSANVKPQPDKRPMIVRTRVAEVTVLGTQFNMNVDRSDTLVSVNEGRVRVKRLSDNQLAEVSENHQVIASASRQTDFEVMRRPKSVPNWQSHLPFGIIYGKWLPEESSLLATAHLWHDSEKKEQQPVLLYLAATSVSRGETPVELQAGSRFRIRGTINKPMDVIVGLTTQHLRGGFAGKHLAVLKADSFDGHPSDFEFVVPIEEFFPQEPEYPKSAIGLGLYDWWCLTINEDAGLNIKSVELISRTKDN